MVHAKFHYSYSLKVTHGCFSLKRASTRVAFLLLRARGLQDRKEAPSPADRRRVCVVSTIKPQFSRTNNYFKLKINKSIKRVGRSIVPCYLKIPIAVQRWPATLVSRQRFERPFLSFDRRTRGRAVLSYELRTRNML